MNSGNSNEDVARFVGEDAPTISKAIKEMLDSLETSGLSLMQERDRAGELIRVEITDKKGHVVLAIDLNALKEAKI